MTNGTTRHKSPVALILIDVINDFDFPDGDRLLREALPVAENLARLKQRARMAGIPAIYVNDNFGQWRSEASKLVRYCLRPQSAGKEFVERIRPDEEDYFVLKPFGILSDAAGDSAAVSGRVLADPGRARNQQLHCLHGARREDARFSADGSGRLLGRENASRTCPGD